MAGWPFASWLAGWLAGRDLNPSSMPHFDCLTYNETTMNRSRLQSRFDYLVRRGPSLSTEVTIGRLQFNVQVAALRPTNPIK